MAKKETRYHRYVGTTTFSRLVEPIENDQILLLSTQRSWQEEAIKYTSKKLPYLKATEKKILHIDINYHSLVDGKFDKDTVLDTLNTSGARDVSLDSLDLLVPKDLELGKCYSEIDEKYCSYETEQFVARFKKYIARSERVKENDYIRFLDTLRDSKLEGELGFEYGSMDFEYAIPATIWHEITRGRISKQYQSQLEEWKDMHRKIATKDIRQLSISLFPNDMVRGREYTLEGGKGEWILSKHGDF